MRRSWKVISVYPNSLDDQQHGSPQPFLASGVPINAYDFRTTSRRPRRADRGDRLGEMRSPRFALIVLFVGIVATAQTVPLRSVGTESGRVEVDADHPE
jgi:hypothetical protein